MIDKRDVQAFFDRLAPDWDAGMVRNEAVIARILDNAGVCEGCTVLDVACGTGVLFGDYVKRGAARVTAVDLSPEMAARAAEKAAGTQITVVCGDVEDSAAVRDSGPYDVVMVYNAFPHFPDPAGLIRTLAGLVRPGGRLSIAHGMSRAALDAHHSGSAHAVSMRLLRRGDVPGLRKKKSIKKQPRRRPGLFFYACGMSAKRRGCSCPLRTRLAPAARASNSNSPAMTSTGAMKESFCVR